MKKILFLLFIVFAFIFNLNFVLAEPTGGLVPCTDDCTAQNLFGGGNTPNTRDPIWTQLIQTALGISGIVILLFFVVGGVMMIVSRGEKGLISKAQAIMKNSIIGLIIVFLAFTIVKFVIFALAGSNWAIFFGE